MNHAADGAGTGAAKDGVGATDRRLLRLAPTDNVVTALAPVRAGEILVIDGRPVTIETSLPLGHKLAARAIASGEKIIKYGAAIGSATVPIRAGAHVHFHNVRSDYLPAGVPGLDRPVAPPDPGPESQGKLP